MNAARRALMAIAMFLITGPILAQSSKNISVSEFEKKLAATKEKTVLDVRTSNEFSQGHLANAVNIDYYKSDFKENVGKLDKNKPVFVYCLSGGRSSSAAGVLKDLGFKEIFNMQGGMKAWSDANKEVIKK